MNDEEAGTTLERRSGQAFERMIAEFYRAFGWRVITNTNLAGQQTDILVTRYIEGMGLATSIVECKDWARPINNQEVQNFIATVVSLREAGKVQFGVMVGASGFSSQARAAAEHVRFLTLLQPRDLEADVVNATFAMQQLVSEYEDQDISQDFVSIDGRAGTWLDLGGSKNGGFVNDVVSHIVNSITDEKQVNFFLLADYGAGKTTLLRRIQHQLISARLGHQLKYLPVFIALKNFHDTQDLSLLIRNSIRDDFLRDLTTESLWSSIHKGQFAFLFDGFDEMSDRSSEGSRANLFARLLPALTSPCPVVLTSRPSLFIAKEELSTLIQKWRADSKRLSPISSTVAQPSKDAVRRHAALESLHKNLMNRMRATTTSHQSEAPELSPDELVSIISLEPFNEEKILSYLQQRLASGARATHATVDQVFDFIQRVYDLSDLASRPLLLRLIVDTIIEGGVDVTDPALQFGPSGLYELYTTIKLDLDWDKGSVRRGALTREQRRQFAESLAVLMQQRDTLRVPLIDVLQMLPEEFDKASNGAETTLSAEEVVTDFLACSFLTIDSSQDCRFVHRSFQEFFVARTIKQKLKSSNAQLSDSLLPTSILYFLGGFAPTEPSVAERLWFILKYAPTPQRLLRRNVLAAYLFSKPEHSSRRFRHYELFQVSYGKLAFENAEFLNFTFEDVVTKELHIIESRWREVRFIKSTIDHLPMRASSVSVRFDQSVMNEVEVINSFASFSLVDCVSRFSLSGSDVNLTITRSRITSLEANDCTVTLSMLGSFMERVQISRSRVELPGMQEGDHQFHAEGDLLASDRPVMGSGSTATASVVVVKNVRSLPRGLQLSSSILQVGTGDAASSGSVGHLASVFSQLSSNSCILAIEQSLDYRALQSGGPNGSQSQVGLLGVRIECSLEDLQKLSIWGIVLLHGDRAPQNIRSGFQVVSRQLAICTEGWLTEAFNKGGALEALSPLVSGDPTRTGLVKDASKYLQKLSQLLASQSVR